MMAASSSTLGIDSIDAFMVVSSKKDGEHVPPAGKSVPRRWLKIGHFTYANRIETRHALFDELHTPYSATSNISKSRATCTGATSTLVKRIDCNASPWP